MCVPVVIYCVNLSGVFVCACLCDCVSLMLTAFVGLFVIDCAMLCLLLWCCCLYVFVRDLS